MSIILCYLLLFELKRVMTYMYRHVASILKKKGGGLVQKILSNPDELVTSLSLFVSLFLRQLFTWSQKSGGQLLDNSLLRKIFAATKMGGGGRGVGDSPPRVNSKWFSLLYV